jgi:hypothetical protein
LLAVTCAILLRHLRQQLSGLAFGPQSDLGGMAFSVGVLHGAQI